MKRFVSVGLAIVLFIPPSPPLGHIAMFDEINQPIAMPPKQHEWTVERKKNRKKRRMTGRLIDADATTIQR